MHFSKKGLIIIKNTGRGIKIDDKVYRKWEVVPKNVYSGGKSAIEFSSVDGGELFSSDIPFPEAATYYKPSKSAAASLAARSRSRSKSPSSTEGGARKTKRKIRR